MTTPPPEIREGVFKDNMREFIETLFKGSTGYLAAAYRKGPKGEFKNRVYKLPDLEPFYKDVAEASSKGYDCYFVPAVLGGTSRKKAFFKESRVAWIDFDKPLPTGEVPHTEKEPSFVVQSSPGKYHMYWLLDEAVGPWPTEGANKHLIEAVGEGADKSGFDCTQLLRVPGTLNYKYDPPASVELVTQEPTRIYPVKSFPAPFLKG